MKDDSRFTIVSLILMGASFFLAAFYFDLNELQIDAGTSVLAGFMVCFLTYQDHKRKKSHKELLSVLLAFSTIVAVSMMLVFLTLRDVPFALFVPLYAIGGGVVYWYIDRYVPPRSPGAEAEREQ